MNMVKPVDSAPILLGSKYQLFNDKGQLVGGSVDYEQALRIAAKPTLFGPRPIHVYQLIANVP